jgi:hypothetical protein
MTRELTTRVFSSPFELGFRMVYLLSALRPGGADLQKLILLVTPSCIRETWADRKDSTPRFCFAAANC